MSQGVRVRDWAAPEGLPRKVHDPGEYVSSDGSKRGFCGVLLTRSIAAAICNCDSGPKMVTTSLAVSL